MVGEFPFKNLSKLELKDKKLLIPTMHPFGSKLLAACCRGFGIEAVDIPTYINLNLGKQFTSGKECFPCQVTISDILTFLINEKNKLKDRFKPEDYVYLMPESDGPCRFGMYNKFHKIILNNFKEFTNINISYFTTEDSYSTKGIIPDDKAPKFKKIAYLIMVTTDVFDRIKWRVRPYEKVKGETDKFIEVKINEFIKFLEKNAEKLPFNEIYDFLEKCAIEAKKLIDVKISKKPKIGIVGEIYLRTHEPSNQYIIRKIEEFGGEVVNASLCEWVNFVTYENIRKTKLFLKALIKEKLYRYVYATIRKLISLKIEQEYQNFVMKKAYSKVLKHLDIHPDHDVVELEKHLENNNIYSYEVGTEACLSIAGALCYMKEGFNGVVNVFPFSCMPSTITSAILRPIFKKLHFPYLDASFDGTNQPNREIALKTFMFQASQYKKNYFS